MNKLFILVGLSLLMTACMRVYLLKDGITQVPVDTDVYANKIGFDKSLLDCIDTEAIYEEFDHQYIVLNRLDNHIETSIYATYRFYPDGRFNVFILDREMALDSNTFNPEFNGYRGIYYKENGKIRYDYFSSISELGYIGKITGTFKFNGDTLYVKRDDTKGINKTIHPVNIYIKRQLPLYYLDYKSNW
jgi:hypothetical protein